ncbi:enoyl-CoA hydratase-related protein [Leptospira wolffii]|uniref:enoyl-CoA hydratase-related protein n=1 Tax=Leptospira wolffii TaxID=409998 RepID=UPI0002E742BA|nr:enoyl-CoA hydratase-related protein [Leptospira wolffii]EPG65544.1 enoyl-CoA hydratase/isomerase family protein [Leptospira wolffii serovar Khorat str. Khorat-H2]
MSETVLYSIEDYTSIITLNRPEKRNAISRDLLLNLMSHIEKIKSDQKTRVLIIQGEGSVFCAGADLKERAEMSEKEVHRFLDDVGKCFQEIESLPIPTIAALDGDAYGGGLELALSCDFILMNSNAKVGLTETGLGIIPGAGGTQRLPRRIGTTKALELILTAAVIDADTALRLQLANSVWHDSAFMAAKRLAATLSEKAPISLKLAKAAIREGLGKEIGSALKIERKHYNRTLNTEDRLEALAAFREKRKPQFKGK